MRYPHLLRTTLFGFIGISTVFLSALAFAGQKPSAPPVAPVKPVIDTFYGMKVVDPYRYMENLKDPAVDQWFKQENTYAHSVLDRISGRKKMLAGIEKYASSTPAKISKLAVRPPDLYFYEKLVRGQQVPKLYVRHGLSGRETLLLDPAKYRKKGGPPWAINYYSASPDGRYVVVCVSPGGSEMAVLHVFDVRTGQETGTGISRTVFERVAWRHDGHAFFYSRLRKLPAHASVARKYEKSRVYLHVIGAGAAKDQPVFGYGVSPRVAMVASDFPEIVTSPRSSYALGLIHHGVQSEVTIYAAPLDRLGKPHVPWKKVAGKSDDVTAGDMHGHALYLLTHKNAPRYKIVRVDLAHPDIAHAATVIPQRQRAIIKNLSAAGDALYVSESKGVVSHLLRLPYDAGKPTDITLPFAGNVGALVTDAGLPGVVFPMTSWIRAKQLFVYKPASGKVTNTHLQSLGPYGAPEDLVSREVTVKSYDGTKVPLSIVYRKGTKLDGSNPTLLMGYGAYGFTIPNEPYGFIRPWYEHGGVLAVAHVRGGGALGEAWHKAGQKLTKPNSWRDFIACARYLIGHKYTSRARLGIWSVSAGGILVGRAMTEQPNLFAVVIDQVGASNPLRIGHMASGPANYPEFGSPDTQAGFEDLYAMDSYHHVRDGVKYPAVLLTTGWNDPRVAPWQAGKMAARLQAATASDQPVLLRVNYSGGHAAFATRHQNETLWADAMSFALWQMGVPEFGVPR